MTKRKKNKKYTELGRCSVLCKLIFVKGGEGGEKPRLFMPRRLISNAAGAFTIDDRWSVFWKEKEEKIHFVEKERRSDCESLENLAGKPRRKKKKKRKSRPELYIIGNCESVRYQSGFDCDYYWFYIILLCFFLFFLSFFLSFFFVFFCFCKWDQRFFFLIGFPDDSSSQREI